MRRAENFNRIVEPNLLVLARSTLGRETPLARVYANRANHKWRSVKGVADVAPTKRQGKYVRTYVRVGEKEEETGSRSGSLLHIHTGLKSGPWERRRRTKGRKGGQQSPIIHDTREHGETVVCLDIARGKRAVVRRFCCLLFRFPQIRFVSGTRCSDYQATKKKKKREDRSYRRG